VLLVAAMSVAEGQWAVQDDDGSLICSYPLLDETWRTPSKPPYGIRSMTFLPPVMRQRMRVQLPQHLDQAAT
jgi:hypothetical protein